MIIFPKKDMFTDNIFPIISNGVATIGRKSLIPKGIGTVIWDWTDDKGKLRKNKLKNVIYFPESLVNTLSTNVLTESMKDNEGTWALTKIKYSIFTWNFWKYKRTISHS